MSNSQVPSSIQYRFPQDFWWGSASSAPQMEGAADRDGKGKSIWDYWYEQEPYRFHNGVGPQTTSRFYDRYQSDIALMKELGHNSFRFSIAWSRMFPEGKGACNEQAVDFYNRVIDRMLEQEIEPFVNLFHFDMPLALQRSGGWENRKVVEAYVRYAETCFKRFGDRVKKWFTHNEPIVPVEAGYLYNLHYPNVIDFRRAVQVAYHSILAHAKAVQSYRQAGGDGKIGIILNLTPTYPRSQHPADQKAARVADAFFNRSFLDPVVKGHFPPLLVELLQQHGFLPETQPEDQTIIRENTVDWLGINYYQPRRVKAKEFMSHPDSPFMPERFFDPYELPGRKMNLYRGWEIYEKGIYDILIDLRDHYDNIECFISENGMGVEGEERYRQDGIIQDDYRVDFIREHLKWVHRALQEGCNVRGYHLWTFMDNWSWLNAYKNRYGLVSVDLERDGERTIKKSGQWFRTLVQNGGF